ncbi:MAG: alpha/beta fold hydrolase [Burkholderiaceae bacterium]
MRILHDFAHTDRPAKSLVILLPGALQQPEDFVAAGFIAALRQRRLPIDLTLVDLGIDYIGETTNGSTLQRIDTELMQAARRQHYHDIWLGGISIGGLIAIAYADRYPGQVDGLCLLSPYPGNRMLLREIEAAGGLDQWPADAIEDEDAERRMWRWLQARKEPACIHLGYGSQDRFAPGLEQVAAALATQHVDTIPGGHDWPTWAKLWENFLDQTFPNLRPDTGKTAE